MVYVRHASNLLKTGFKLLYIVMFVLFGIYMLQRNVNWMYTLLKGTRLHRLPKGIFCLAKNLTEVIATIEKDQLKEFYQPTLHKGKIMVIGNGLLYCSFVTYCYFAALNSRSDIHIHKMYIL